MDAYRMLEVRPPTPGGLLKRWSWRLHGKLLPLLHFSGDLDVFVNLRVLWNKAITSCDVNSLAYEGPDEADRITYHMLPRVTRWVIRYFNRFFPRWFHANIELRTVYLNQALEKEVERIRKHSCNIRLIVLGAGYDGRSMRLLSKGMVQEVWELDLEKVVTYKSKHLMPRLFRELPHTQAFRDQWNFMAVDLNDLSSLQQAMEYILSQSSSNDVYTIFLVEAVLMYLEPDMPQQILKLCAEKSRGASFMFADRLLPRGNPNLSEKDQQEACRQWLRSTGWKLQHFRTKPGATRHMGACIQQRERNSHSHAHEPYDRSNDHG